MPKQRLEQVLFGVALLGLGACASADKTTTSKKSIEPAPKYSISAEKKVVFDEWTKGIETCASPLDQSVNRFLASLPAGKSLVDMSAFFDFLLPANAADAKKMNGMALLAIRIYGSRLDGFPMQKIYWAPDADRSQLYMLPPIFPKLPLFSLEDTKHRKLGKYRNDGYFFFPLELLNKKGEIYAVLSDGGKPVRVTRLPVKGHAVPASLRIKPDAKKIPDPQFIVPIVLDRYCLGV